MKKRSITIGIVAGLVLSTGVIGAYFAGIWIPNFPAESDYPIRGIDVSRHQGVIQWSLVPCDEVQFAYIKATEGSDYRDARFAENWNGSGTTGLRRGAYHFFTLKTPGLQQAANFTAVVPKESDALPPLLTWSSGATRLPDHRLRNFNAN